MKRLPVFFLIAFSVISIQANAQSPAVKVLKQSLAAMGKYKTLHYETNSVNKNIFSENDTTHTKTQETLSFDANGKLLSLIKLSNINNGQSLLKEIFHTDTLYTVAINDSTYTTAVNPKAVSNSLTPIVNLINRELKPEKLSLRKDTIIEGIRCYNIFINAYDTIENNNHSFTHHYIAINRATMLPVYYKQLGAGVVKKEDYVIGRLSIFSSTHFQSYRFNQQLSKQAFAFDKAGFDTVNTKMLAEGITAPNITVRSLDNITMPSSYFKNKVILIGFNSTVCAANPLSNPVINRLSTKYKASDVVIAGVYCEDTAEQVKKYVKNNDLLFPIYLGSLKLRKEFKTIATPNFYVIDQYGKVAAAFSGYNDELEKNIVTEIDKLRVAGVR